MYPVPGSARPQSGRDEDANMEHSCQESGMNDSADLAPLYEALVRASDRLFRALSPKPRRNRRATQGMAHQLPCSPRRSGQNSTTTRPAFPAIRTESLDARIIRVMVFAGDVEIQSIRGDADRAGGDSVPRTFSEEAPSSKLPGEPLPLRQRQGAAASSAKRCCLRPRMISANES